MKATLLPLRKKYYATEILVTSKGTKYEVELNAQVGLDPSDRELKIADITRKDWNNSPAEFMELFDSSHCESQQTYEDALHIVNCINKEGE